MIIALDSVSYKVFSNLRNCRLMCLFGFTVSLWNIVTIQKMYIVIIIVSNFQFVNKNTFSIFSNYFCIFTFVYLALTILF